MSSSTVISTTANNSSGPLLDPEEHIAAVQAGIELAQKFDRLRPDGPILLARVNPDAFSLEQWQTPFRDQRERGCCWAFAGAAALEAAYRRRFNLLIDISEEYVFHMGKSFALNGDGQGGIAQPVENNSSLTGFQGSGDICKKLSENAVAPEEMARYLRQAELEGFLPVLGYTGVAALMNQEDFDAIEFCEQHIPLLARVNARYRATGWASLGGNPSIEALENTISAEHEVVCDVTQVGTGGGHVLVLVGYDRNRRVFTAKNSWGENAFIEIAYENDPNWMITSGWYLEDVVDPTFVQNEACWLGNWFVTTGNGQFRMLLRRSEDFLAPGTATRLGSAYLGDGRHDVNGSFSAQGKAINLFIAPSTAVTKPGTLSGTALDAELDFVDLYNAAGTLNGQPVSLSRFQTRFAALFQAVSDIEWQARHGIDAQTYQTTFDDLVRQGFRLTTISGYSEGPGARFNAVWVRQDGPAWEARHGLDAAGYQAAFDALATEGFRLRCVSGYAEHGAARYAALWDKAESSEWTARHGLSRADYQATFDAMAAQGFVPVHVCGYRVGLDVQFAAIWEKRSDVAFVGRHGLTASQYQQAFDEQAANGFRLICVSGYSDTGVARYAAIWHSDNSGLAWQGRHGLDAASYQQQFDMLAAQGFRPVQISGYGDGFYAA